MTDADKKAAREAWDIAANQNWYVSDYDIAENVYAAGLAAGRAEQAKLRETLQEAQLAMNWHRWNDRTKYPDRQSCEARASDLVETALAALPPAPDEEKK
jgi:hypothetical protein